jgi:predicted Zn-dependent protease
MMQILLLLATLLTLAAPIASAQNYKIPGFGEGNAVSLDQEYYLGRAWLMSFRRQAPIVDDALIQNYVENLVYRLAEKSPLKERRLEVIVVDNPSINAFAVPGGIVGIHSGLIAKAETQAQFSSVLAHELAHLSQRHFSRDFQARKRSAPAAMTRLLDSMVVIATTLPDAGTGKGSASTGSRLRYSTVYEQEADRMGVYTQAATGLDPGGAAEMFAVMQRESLSYDSQPLEYLRAHPLTERRDADIRDRAAAYPKRIYENSREFQLIRTRVALSFIEGDEEAITHFREKRARGGRNAVPAQYGLILALTRGGYLAEARELLQPMREFSPDNIVYRIAEAEIDIEAGKYDVAVATLQEGLSLSPNNHPLTMSVANAYIQGTYYAKADKILSRHTRSHPGDAHLWFLLSEAQEKSGNTLGMHQSKAEYFALNDALDRAIQQLNVALSLAKNQITAERINTRIAYFDMIEQALVKLR